MGPDVKGVQRGQFRLLLFSSRKDTHTIFVTIMVKKEKELIILLIVVWKSSCPTTRDKEIITVCFVWEWLGYQGDWQLSTHLSRCNGSRANMKMYSQYIFLSNIKLIFLGCPFRHYDADILRQKLVAYNVPYPAIKEVTILIILMRLQAEASSNHFTVLSAS